MGEEKDSAEEKEPVSEEKEEQKAEEINEEKVEEKVNEKENKKEEKKENVEEEKHQEEYKTVKTKKPLIPIIIAVTIIMCLIIAFSVIFALMNINNDKILSNISIMGVDVSKLSKEEAIDKIKQLTEKEVENDITLKYEDYETTITGKQISAQFNVEAAVNEAYNIGKDGNIIVNNYNILWTKLFKREIEIPLQYDGEVFNKKIEEVSSKIPGAVKQYSYYTEDDKLIIVNGKAGIKIKEDEIKEAIINTLKQLDQQNNIIDIPVQSVEPEKIDLAKIREEIYKEAQDAYVSKNPTTVHPNVNGVDFGISIEEAQKLLEEDKKEYTIPLKITVAKVTVSDLGEKAFPDLLATYTTRYDASNTGRANNLTLAAKKINGTVLMPKEVFSYNQVVGKRTIEAGYKEAAAYAGGKVIQSVGGGICQISSTLYNTALLANLEIVQRSNHQFQTSYVAASRDATVSWGSLDFKFKNSRSYPIKITASAKNGVAKVSIYGIKEETEYEVVIQSKVISYIPNSVKYIEDSTLAKGKEVVVQSGHNGCKSEAYRILKLNGKVISKTLLSRDTYDSMQRIVKRGTKTVTTQKPASTGSQTTNQGTTTTQPTTSGGTSTPSTETSTTTSPTTGTETTTTSPTTQGTTGTTTDA